MTVSTANPPAMNEPSALLDVQAVAAMLGVSTRHVYRLADAGKCPPPIRLGRLLRWPREKIQGWIADDCKPCRTARS